LGRVRLGWDSLRVPLLTRLLLANALVVAVGAVAGTLITRALADRSSLALMALFVLVGTGLSLLLNYVVLRVTLRPLTDLSSAVDGVRDGETSLRAPLAVSQDHDDTSQSLASLLIALELMDGAIPPELTDLKNRLASARDLTAETIDGLRALVVYLRPLLLDDLGLVPAIRWYAGNRLGPEGIDLEFHAPDDLPRISPEAETALFRIAQEAINNIVKHADASTVRVSLLAEDGVTLLIEDDGLGFEGASVLDEEGSAHLGLFGIHERAAAIGGALAVESSPGVGTTIRVHLPAETG
jgi:two-component system sensor histidine kinase UhpB